jgi:hypothetical protein
VPQLLGQSIGAGEAEEIGLSGSHDLSLSL